MTGTPKNFSRSGEMADFLFYPPFLKNLIILIFLFTWKEKGKYLLSVSTSDNVCGPIASYSLRFVLNIFDFFIFFFTTLFSFHFAFISTYILQFLLIYSDFIKTDKCTILISRNP